MMRIQRWITIGLVACVGIPGGAQRATGGMTGVVVSDETPPRPVRRATVSLVAPDLGVPLSTVTDDEGRFAFAGVPAGHYAVVASKPAYVGAFYGSKRPGRGPGVPVAVRPGAVVDRVSLTLTRGSVITGMLRLPSGEPAHNMPVIAIAVETSGGTTRWTYAGGRTATDDRGEYRIFGLPAGEYLVIAQPSGLIMGSPTGAADAPQTTPAEVSWAEEMARGRATGGAPSVAAPPRGPTANYATVFYPGTADAARAAPVRVESGEERRGVDFALMLVPTARVSGTIVDRNGQPLRNVSIALNAPGDRLSLAGIAGGRPAVTSAADGSFTMPAVAPGRYQLAARAPVGAAAET
jgi:protocatechuate 3,4-dioxygenase beta subunit